MRRFILALLITGLLPMLSVAGTKGGTVISRSAQAVDYTQDIDVSGLREFSFQVDYTSTTPSEDTVSDGAFASATLTVANYAALNGQPATATITIEDGFNADVENSVITINGRTTTEGVDYDYDVTYVTMTAYNLAAALDAHWEYSAAASSNVITLTAYQNGTAANSWTLTSSTATCLSTVTWANGQNAGYFGINGTYLVEGTDWNAATSSDTTANSIEDAINASTTLSAIVTASNTALGVVTVTAKTSGVNAYPVSVSNASYLTPNYYRLNGGAASDISVAADTISQASHGYSVGLPVLFSTVSAATPPTGLVDQTTYYIIPVNTSSYQLSDTSTGAVAGLDIDITAVAGGGSFTVTPIAFTAGSCAFKWQGSNDDTTYYDLSYTSVTFSDDGGALWDFTSYPYKWLRFYYIAPTYGGLNITGTIFGREE